MDYSKTVNLPQSDFPMKANLPEREPLILAEWEKQGLYKKIIDSRKNCELYILHDGPPYANGHLHIGHALNKILKDIIIKHKTMMNMKAPYVPGWDCHGLPIELNVTRMLGDRLRNMDRLEIRDGCREYAEKFISIQMDEFRRMGVFADYENPYKTMSRDYETTIIGTFAELFKKGYISRSKKPIYWCPACVTALAEAEVEYGSHESSSIYVKFRVDPASITQSGLKGRPLYVLIWTTTPWTIPANLAVCFHPDFAYSAADFGGEQYIVADGLIENIEKIAGAPARDRISLNRGDIEKLRVMHPFIDRESKVIFGTHVTLEQGTGIVHTAPGHGHEDYVAGLEHGLDIFCPVDGNGRFTDEFALMKGLNVFEANDKIIELLRDNKTLIHSEKIEHSYPHCWRCKKPLIFRATEQWFFSIDHNNLREAAKRSINETGWVPSWGESRFRSMAENRPDWCLSRQRIWGVPIPSFRCADCGDNMMSAESLDYFVDISSREGVDAWFSKDIAELVPHGSRCACGSSSFTKEYDILDVWFDSGVSHFAVLDSREGLSWPADLYLEGSDQHRGWFQSSLWPALALRGRAPFKTVLTHGFVLDEKGKAMSKSLGNVIAPEELISRFGADILRIWVSSEDYRNDLRIGFDMIKQNADSYRRIRNTFKFIIGNLSDFSEADAVPYEKLTDLDKWILHENYILCRQVIEHYEKFEFHMVFRKIVNFCAVELSSLYFDISKDILYVEAGNSLLRRSNQTALHEIFLTLVKLIAPVLPFTAEEIWQFGGERESIHLKEYYIPAEVYCNTGISEKMEKIIGVKKDVLKALEIKRKEGVLKSSLEADIEIYLPDGSLKELLADNRAELRRLFQVASVEIFNDKKPHFEDYEKSSIGVKITEGRKCVRCWNYFSGSNGSAPEICGRCAEIIRGMNNE